MSEAELHVLRARLQGGILNKARRGELFLRPPIGFDYDALGGVVLDPDQQIQHTIRMLFDTFQRTGSAHGNGPGVPQRRCTVSSPHSFRSRQGRCNLGQA